MIMDMMKNIIRKIINKLKKYIVKWDLDFLNTKVYSTDYYSFHDGKSCKNLSVFNKLETVYLILKNNSNNDFEFRRMGLSGIDIKLDHEHYIVYITLQRPGYIIGYQGKTVDKIKEELSIIFDDPLLTIELKEYKGDDIRYNDF